MRDVVSGAVTAGPPNVIKSKGNRRNTVEDDFNSVECECALDSRKSSAATH